MIKELINHWQARYLKQGKFLVDCFQVKENVINSKLRKMDK